MVDLTNHERDLYDVIHKSLPGDQATSVIEMGCGNSDWLPFFCTHYGYDVYGIDYLEVACELSESKLRRAGCNGFQIFCGDFRELHETVGRKFDILVSFGVIEHFDDPVSLVETFGGYLKEGGVMITICPNTAGLAMALQKYVDRAIYDGHKRFDLERLTEFHRQGSIEPILSSYLGYMSLNNLDFSGYGLLGHALKGLIKLLNGPLVVIFHFLRKLGFRAASTRFWGSMLVVARK